MSSYPLISCQYPVNIGQTQSEAGSQESPLMWSLWVSFPGVQRRIGKGGETTWRGK